jgi:alkanesulfonate monooxygenase SsuD/methylene tetrahydromethanopterin reductase-like flavin-dependent oxidoreductase (luciferase family)
MTSPWSILGKYTYTIGDLVGLCVGAEDVGEDVCDVGDAEVGTPVGETVDGLPERREEAGLTVEVVGALVGALVGATEVGTPVGVADEIVGLLETGEEVVGLTVTTVGESEGEKVVGVLLIVGAVGSLVIICAYERVPTTRAVLCGKASSM